MEVAFIILVIVFIFTTTALGTLLARANYRVNNMIDLSKKAQEQFKEAMEHAKTAQGLADQITGKWWKNGGTWTGLALVNGLKYWQGQRPDGTPEIMIGLEGWSLGKAHKDGNVYWANHPDNDFKAGLTFMEMFIDEAMGSIKKQLESREKPIKK